MVDVFGKAKRSEVMAAIRSSGNKDTELRLIQIFRQNSISGWRRHSLVEGKPDFIFPRGKIALFVDGCFWHGCPTHGRVPSSNSEYWESKLQRNALRDKLVNKALRAKGWKVVRLWEHDLRDSRKVARRVLKIIFERTN